MKIRKATLEDSKMIAECLMLAMEEIVYAFMKEKDYAKAQSFLLHFIEQENTQYSYQHCWVAEIENEIVGTVLMYNGADLHALRLPVVNYVRRLYNPDFNPEDETQAGEYYIDSLGVKPELQGQGIGTALLHFVMQHYGMHTLGLLVDEENPAAKKLYLNLGFRMVGKKTLLGKKLEHLQFRS